MPVQSFYQGGQRNVGAPIAGEFLAQFFDERKRMNDRADAFAMEQAEDPTELAEMELKARDRLGDLSKALTAARAGDKKSARDLSEAYIRAVAGITQANIRAQSEIAGKRIWLEMGMQNVADNEAKRILKASQIDDADEAQLSNLGSDPTSNVGGIVNTIRSIQQKSDAVGKGNVLGDAMAVRAFAAVAKNKGRDFALEVAKQLGYDDDPNIFYNETHNPMGSEEAHEWARDIGRQYGAGISPTILDRMLLDHGIDPAELGSVEESGGESRRSGGGGGGEPVAGRGLSVGMSGASPEAARELASALKSGADPYDAIVAAIEAQSNYADELAERRRAAASNKRSIYPRPNPYTTTPNRYPSRMPEARRIPRLDADPVLPEVAPPSVGTVSVVETDLARDWRSQADSVPEVRVAPTPTLEPQSVRGTRFDPGDVTTIKEAIGSDPFDDFLDSYQQTDDFDAFLNDYKVTP